jgi:hypothetical protein
VTLVASDSKPKFDLSADEPPSVNGGSLMKMLQSAWILATVFLAGAVLAPAMAGVDIDFGVAAEIDDRTDLYFSISSRYFGQDRETVTNWGARYRDPDDLAVVLFIRQHSERSLDELYALRQQRGLTWWEIAVRYGVPTDVWFVPVQRDPGPPYGKAYGHWKKHKHDRATPVVFSDADLRNLVAVRMMHEYYGVPVELAMEWRSGGSDLRALMTDEYVKRHGNPHDTTAVASGKSDKPGKGHGRKK